MTTTTKTRINESLKNKLEKLEQEQGDELPPNYSAADLVKYAEVLKQPLPELAKEESLVTDVRLTLSDLQIILKWAQSYAESGANFDDKHDILSCYLTDMLDTVVEYDEETVLALRHDKRIEQNSHLIKE